MRLTWFGHSTVLVDVDGVRVLSDPLLRRRVMHLWRHEIVAEHSLGRIDGVVISHGHWDHLDLPSLERTGRSARVVVPRGLAGLVRGRGLRDVVEVEAGEETDVGGLRVVATPAEHASSRRRFGPKTRALGYVFAASRRVYFAGDTDLFAGMADLGPVDVALLPVSGWGPRLPTGHLDPRAAAEALRLLRARVGIPIHWGTYAPWRARPADRRRADEFARHAAELAPEAEVRIPALGEPIDL